MARRQVTVTEAGLVQTIGALHVEVNALNERIDALEARLAELAPEDPLLTGQAPAPNRAARRAKA